MKQSKGLNGDLKTTNMTTMAPTTDIDSQYQPSETNWGGKHQLAREPTQRRAV